MVLVSRFLACAAAAQTVKMVKIDDPCLGCLHYSLTVAIFLYIVVIQASALHGVGHAGREFRAWGVANDVNGAPVSQIVMNTGYILFEVRWHLPVSVCTVRLPCACLPSPSRVPSLCVSIRR